MTVLSPTGGHDDFGGLGADLQLTATAIKRRSVLKLAAIGGLGALSLAGCTEIGRAEVGGEACRRIPEETAGPFPGDGSIGPNVLDLAGVVRSDVRSSFAGLDGVAGGVPLTVQLRVVDSENGCEPAPGYAVYIWHCDRAGLYSLYSPGATDQNYLRGVQECDGDGVATFTTIFPGCYPGRWPHIHFEVFPNLASATDEGNKIATSQLAFPEAACLDAYATEGYEASARNLEGITLTGDSVFRDSVGQLLAATSGDAGSGFRSRLTVAI